LQDEASIKGLAVLLKFWYNKGSSACEIRMSMLKYFDEFA